MAKTLRLSTHRTLRLIALVVLPLVVFAAWSALSCATDVTAFALDVGTALPSPTMVLTATVSVSPTLVPTQVLSPTLTAVAIPPGTPTSVSPSVSPTSTSAISPTATRRATEVSPTAAPRVIPTWTPIVTPTRTFIPTVTAIATLTPTLAPGFVTGYITLEGRGDSAGITITVLNDLLDPPKVVSIGSTTAVKNNTNFVSSLAPGTYQILVAKPGYLPTQFSLQVASGKTITMPSEKLIAGDVNEDHSIDMADVQVMRLAFGSKKGDLRFDAITDLNGDGAIDILDMALMSSHFGEKSKRTSQ